ncbi:MAG: quinone-dependent dihydroorotate dehydrogenase [Acidobacteriota bacterium]
MIYAAVRTLLFQLDAESAHEWTVEQIRRIQRIPIALRVIEALAHAPQSPRTLLGLTFRNPIGIAAGFDKNAVMIPMLAALGFGFIEVGTVTLHPQPGNPRPRLFRDPQRRALINRLGFNNDGADAVAARLRTRNRTVPLFVNIGKNRDVPLEAAAEVYGACAEKLAPHADAVVINISSPNTPGLRDLQRPEHLERVVRAVPGRKLVKIAPDLDDAQIAEICDVCVRLADGMICTNTTATDGGGLSGKPLMQKSTDVLAKVRARVGADYPLIGVGGVFTADDLRAKLRAGADLVQVYTGFVYEGPMIVKKLLR